MPITDSEMNRGVYSAATGMVSAEKLLDVVTNNLANSSTTGFKQDGVAFANAMENQINSQGRPIGTLGTGSTCVGQYTDFSPGAVSNTGNALDVAINSVQGAFAVQTGPGTISYTRDGSLAIDANRQLVTKQGYPVLGQDLHPITVGQGEIQIAEDGVISANGVVSGTIGVFNGQFQKLGANLFSADGQVTPITPVLSPRSLEASNVNPVQAMLQMITLNRTFELSQNAVQQHDMLTQRLISSLQ